MEEVWTADALPALADAVLRTRVAAAPAIGWVIGEIDAFAIALDRGIRADTRSPFADSVLRTHVAACPTVVRARVEQDALFLPAPAAAADLAVLRLATELPARVLADALTVRVLLEAGGANARHEVVRVARRVGRVRRLADADAIGWAAEVVATAGIATLTDACVALALGASATVAIRGALLTKLLAVGEGRIQAEATQPQGQGSRGQAAHRRTPGTTCRQPLADQVKLLSIHQILRSWSVVKGRSATIWQVLPAWRTGTDRAAKSVTAHRPNREHR